jgi:hypothetical protein
VVLRLLPPDLDRGSDGRSVVAAVQAVKLDLVAAVAHGKAPRRSQKLEQVVPKRSWIDAKRTAAVAAGSAQRARVTDRLHEGTLCDRFKPWPQHAARGDFAGVRYADRASSPRVFSTAS